MTTERIREQLISYRDTAWQLDHCRAMECHDLDDWLAFGLSLLSGIRTIDRQYHDRVQQGRSELDRTVVEAIQGLYEIWFSPCNHLIQAIEQFEREGYVVDNSAAFREACSNPNVIGFDAARITKAADQFAKASGRPLGEAMDAVRRRAIG